MGVSLYNTGISGLAAAQQQLATVGHNIANVNNKGYTRQRGEQNSVVALRQGANFNGGGTYVQDVTRIFNQFSYKEQLSTQNILGKADSLNQNLSQLDQVMSTSGTALNSSISSFYQSVNSIADNPNDPGLRSIALSQANVLTSNFKTVNDNIDQLKKSINGEITQVATQITDIAQQLAKLNVQILQTKNRNGTGHPNDLLDKRDLLLSKLAKFTNVSTVQNSNGVTNIMIGNGSTLVSGGTSMSVQVQAGDPDPSETQLRLTGQNGSVLLSGKQLGGSLGGKFQFRDQYLKQTRQDINRLALAFSNTINSAQAKGLDLNQIQGAKVFSDINSTDLQSGRVFAFSSNTGTLQGEVKITDTSVLPASEFEVQVIAGNYTLTNLSTGASTSLGAKGAGTYNTGFGFNFVEKSGTAANNDKFILRPGANTMAKMAVVMKDGNAIAASTAVKITPSDHNVSSGEVSITEMLDPVNARAAMPMRIDVLENPVGTFKYTYTDKTGTTSAPISYTPPSQTVNLPPSPATTLFKVTISGNPSGVAPNGPEQFNISDAFGVGNGNNALTMAKTQMENSVDGSSKTFSQSLASTTANVGSQAKSASLVANTAQAMFTQAYNRNQAASGVNLDEEAANMLKFQQAYQASSKIISVANTIFNAILQAVR